MTKEEYELAYRAIMRGHMKRHRVINSEYDEIIATISATGRGDLGADISNRSHEIERLYVDHCDAIRDLNRMYRTALESHEVPNV